MDSLLSIVQMPAGVPVGTLAIGKAGRDQRRRCSPRRSSPTRTRRWRSGSTPGARRRPDRWPKRPNDRRRARPSASSAAASSAACWRWPRRSSATNATSSTRTSIRRAADVAAYVTRARRSTTPTRCERFGGSGRRRHLRIRESARRRRSRRSATSCGPATRSLAIAQDRATRESSSSSDAARGSRRGARSSSLADVTAAVAEARPAAGPQDPALRL